MLERAMADVKDRWAREQDVSGERARHLENEQRRLKDRIDRLERARAKEQRR